MSTKPMKPAAPKAKTAAKPPIVPPPAKLVNDGGKPKGGKHVPSIVPGAGASDYSGSVGSNVVPAKGVPASKSSDVMDAPPYLAPRDSGMSGGSPIG